MLAVLAVAVGYEAWRVYGGTNDHEVIPGRVYRSAQMSEGELTRFAERHGIRTVLNLRGTAPWDDQWYQPECRATIAAGISQEDVTLSAQTLPFPSELRKVVEVLDRTEYPVLFHCNKGADRTGLVAAVALLLYTDATLDEARRQLWPRYGHWPVARTIAIDQFFDLYQAKLAAGGEGHTPERFRRWVLTEYVPGPARSRLSWVTPPTAVMPAHSAVTLRVRCENLSDTPWRMTPGKYAGVHVSYAVYGEGGTEPVADGRSGLRFETVPPGGSTEVAIPVKMLPAGRYRVVAEMHDATGAGIPFRTQAFSKFGDESLVAVFEVR